MIYVVRENSNEILSRCDAWELNGQAKMIAWARSNGYTPLRCEITLGGDMVILVA